MKYKLLEGNNLFIIIIIIILISSLIYTNYISTKIENFIIENKNNKISKLKKYSQDFENKIINMQINNKYEITNLLNHIIQNKDISFVKRAYNQLRKVILTTQLPKYLQDDKNDYLENMDKLINKHRINNYNQNGNNKNILFKKMKENRDKIKKSDKKNKKINNNIDLEEKKNQIISKVLKKPNFYDYNMKKPSPININISFNEKNKIDTSNIGKNILSKNKYNNSDNKNLNNHFNNKYQQPYYQYSVVKPIFPVLYSTNNFLPQNYGKVSWTTNPDYFIPKRYKLKN